MEVKAFVQNVKLRKIYSIQLILLTETLWCL